MKIIFDIDGTMTNYRAYIEKYALPWFSKKYGLFPQKTDELELEDILNLENALQAKLNCTSEQAALAAKKLLREYWVSCRFIRFSLFGRFRPGCAGTVRRLKKLGFQVEVYTSRAYTAKQNMVGRLARLCTIGQLWLNGVFLQPAQIRFFPDDKAKLAEIVKNKPSLVYDDKPGILKELCRQNIPAVCIAGPHNTMLQSFEGIERIEGYQTIAADELLKRALGKKLPVLLRAARSDIIWKRIARLAPLFQLYFHPIVLNPSRRIITHDAVLYAPNHRSTLDPLAILTVVKENIHWAALLRFF